MSEKFGTARCVNCDTPSLKSLAKRSACKCGSVVWYLGSRPKAIWRAVTSPMFIAVSTEELTGLINREGE